MYLEQQTNDSFGPEDRELDAAIGRHTEEGQVLHLPRPPHGSQGSGALVYLFGMAAATTSGSAFVIGGMLAGARGLPAVALAAAVPLAGLLWAIMLSLLHRGHVRIRQP